MMGLSIKQRLVRYHIDQRDRLGRLIKQGAPDWAQTEKEYRFHAEAVEFISQGGLPNSF